MSERKLFQTTENEKLVELYGRSEGDLEIYVDGAWGLTYSSGSCKINLFTVVPVEDDTRTRREVAARIVMGVPTLFAMKEFFERQCQELIDRGSVEVESSDAETLQTPDKPSA